MNGTAINIENVDTYIASFPEATQQLLHQLRAIITEMDPDIEELISYKMPAYKYLGPLAYFAGYKNHIGFYGTPSMAHFKEALKDFKTSKGTVQFPLDKPLVLLLQKHKR